MDFYTDEKKEVKERNPYTPMLIVGIIAFLIFLGFAWVCNREKKSKQRTTQQKYQVPDSTFGVGIYVGNKGEIIHDVVKRFTFVSVRMDVDSTIKYFPDTVYIVPSGLTDTLRDKNGQLVLDSLKKPTFIPKGQVLPDSQMLFFVSTKEIFQKAKK